MTAIRNLLRLLNFFLQAVVPLSRYHDVRCRRGNTETVEMRHGSTASYMCSFEK